MSTKISSVVLVEDDKNFSDAFSTLINSSDYYYIKATYDNCEEAIEKLPIDRPDLVLMDLDLPGLDGISGSLKIKQLLTNVQIIVLTVHNDSEKIFKALCAGAVGYITKDSDLKTLLALLDEIRSGGAPMSFDVARKVVESFAKNNATPLSSKETEVLTLLSGGKSYKTIAQSLDISINTVKFHIRNIYLTLQVANREKAIALAKQNKWV